MVKHTIVYHYYYDRSLQDNLVFAESRNGRELAGNVLSILIEIARTKPEMTFAIGATKHDKGRIEAIIDNYHIPNAKVYSNKSITYYKKLFYAKYLINDVTFPADFVKKEGQIYLNTWHGTPYKKLGRDSKDGSSIDNIQRNLLMTDYLLYPNTYCRDRMMESFCIRDLYQGIVIRDGYPRNAIFFDERSRQDTRKKYGIEDKTVYVYMPTYRCCQGTKAQEEIEFLRNMIKRIDQSLSDDEVFFIKLHSLADAAIKTSLNTVSGHIRIFPENIEVNEFLNCADCLITDYSSVFYDFACTGRKIIRFVYDEEDYFKSRGVYEQPVKPPFSTCKTVDGLLRLMRMPKQYDDTEFVEEFCASEDAEACQRIVREIFDQGDCCRKEHYKYNSNKVIIYGGNLAKNGITSSFLNLTDNIDPAKDYCICYDRHVIGDHNERLQMLPVSMDWLEVTGRRLYTITEALAYFLFSSLRISTKWIHGRLDRLNTREFKKCFTGTHFKAYIDYCGYDRYIIELFQRASAKCVIYVHNNMLEEIRLKGNQHRLILHEAYAQYDHVVSVAENLVKSIVEISGRADNVCVVHNVTNPQLIAKKAEMPIEFQEQTVLTMTGAESIEGFFEDHETVLISVSRYSHEKNHLLLIQAFEQIKKKHPDTGLIIIGGMGDAYEDTIKRIQESEYAADIVSIMNIANPMPIMKRCHLFVLSSMYEGRPMVLTEADQLGLPIVATYCEATAEFMREYGGSGLVENSLEGLVNGIEDFFAGKGHGLSIDYEAYDRECMDSFYRVLQ